MVFVSARGVFEPEFTLHDVDDIVVLKGVDCTTGERNAVELETMA